METKKKKKALRNKQQAVCRQRLGSQHFYTNLWCDRESGAETVHSLVVLPAEVEENSQTTLQLRVHLGGVRVSCMQIQGLDISEQRSVPETQKKKNKESQKISMIHFKPKVILNPTCACDTHSGSSDPNLSLSLSLSLAPSCWRSRSFCSHTERYLGLCFSQSRRVSQACLCSDSLVKLTANAIRAVRLSFFSSIHLVK